MSVQICLLLEALKHLHHCYVFYLSDEQNFEKLFPTVQILGGGGGGGGRSKFPTSLVLHWSGVAELPHTEKCLDCTVDLKKKKLWSYIIHISRRKILEFLMNKQRISMCELYNKHYYHTALPIFFGEAVWK